MFVLLSIHEMEQEVSTSLLLDDERISALADHVSRQLADQPLLVAVSGAMYVNPDDTDQARLAAALATATSSRESDVPHLFMLDAKSAAGVSDQLHDAGAIVVPVDEGEGGLARPYLTAALIINELCRRGVLPTNVLMVKVDAEKNIFGTADTPQHYIGSCSDLDVATGVRSAETWESMPHFLQLTESVLSYAIGDLLSITDDTPSGILVLNSAGRHALIETTTENSWTYLIGVPFLGNRQGLKVGSFPIDFVYHPAVSSEENGSASFDQKRRMQVDVMFDYALKLAADNNTGGSNALIRMTNRLKSALRGVCSVIEPT